MRVGSSLVEIAPAKEFLDKAVEQDKEIAAAHFPDLELGNACFSIGPGIRDNGIGIASDYGF